MAPNIVVLPQRDPVEILWRHFPELKLEWADQLMEEPHYLYALFAEQLQRRTADKELWLKASVLFEELADAGSNSENVFMVSVAEPLLEHAASARRLSSVCGPKARELLRQMLD
jgi:hypothetical protein